MHACSLCGQTHVQKDSATLCCSRKCKWCGQHVDFDDYAHEFEDCSDWREAHRRPT